MSRYFEAMGSCFSLLENRVKYMKRENIGLKRGVKLELKAFVRNHDFLLEIELICIKA